jgi:hypothetical protein
MIHSSFDSCFRIGSIECRICGAICLQSRHKHFSVVLIGWRDEAKIRRTKSWAQPEVSLNFLSGRIEAGANKRAAVSCLRLN